MECAAILDACRIFLVIDEERFRQARTLLIRIVQMLSKHRSCVALGFFSPTPTPTPTHAHAHGAPFSVKHPARVLNGFGGPPGAGAWGGAELRLTTADNPGMNDGRFGVERREG